jgi:hypothetical protein
VSPPAGCAAQAEQACGLGGHAVDGHQLLLLAHRAEEPQCVRSEADQPQGRERRQAEPGAGRHSQALARAPGGEHKEGQHEPGRDLDPDACDHRARGGAEAWAAPRGERQRGGEQQEDQRVVVRATDGQLEQHGVQAHEGHRPTRRLTEAVGRPRDQRHRSEARGDRQRLERPQPASERQRGGRIAREGEHRAVWRVLEGPADEREDRVGRRFGGDVRVGVQAVQGTHTGEAQVAEHVLRDQRRPEQQDRVRGDDCSDDRARGQRSCGQQHRQVARAHQQHRRLEAVAADADAQALQRAGHPVRPAAAAPGDVGGGSRGGAGRHEEDRRDDAEQAERAQRTQSAGRRSSAVGSVYAIGRRGGRPDAV